MTPSTRLYKDDQPLLTVCPWAYAICKREGKGRCSVKKNMAKAQDMDEWRRHAEEAQGCFHRGEPISPDQWMHKRSGIVV